MYRVNVDFADAQDRYFVYRKGDEYPRAGLSVSEKRIAELLQKKDGQKVPLISEVIVPLNKEEKPKTASKPKKK